MNAPEPPPPLPTLKLLLRSLQRSAQVFLALVLTNHPWTAGRLAAYLGLDRRTVRANLVNLHEIGLVDHLPGVNGYLLSEKSKQLLMDSPLIQVWVTHSARAPSSINSVSFDSDNQEKRDTVLLARHIVCTTKAQEPEPSGYLRADLLPEADEAVLSALRRAGVNSPVCDELARMPQLSEKHVTRWEQVLKQQAKGRYSTGLLVYQLRRVMPDDPPPDCVCGECSECLRRKYDLSRWYGAGYADEEEEDE